MSVSTISSEKGDKNTRSLGIDQVSYCTQYIPLIRGQDTLYQALNQMQKHKTSVLCVEQGSKKYGFVTQEDILAAYCEGMPLHTTVHQIIRRSALVFLYHISQSEVLDYLTVDQPIAVILDTKEEYMGIVNLSNLLGSLKSSYPSPVGGISTPFGVYLTNGGVSAGAPWWALISTGILLIFLMQVSYSVSYQITSLFFQIEALSSLRNLNLLPGAVFCFLILFRLSPWSGVHGAEHMVIHALERGEPLDKNHVMKMPRVHARCGTNISIALLSGLGIYFLGIGSEISPGKLGSGIDFLIAMGFISLFGTPLGNFVQLFFTTKKPSRVQLNSAIENAKRLNEAYIKSPLVWPNFFLRALKSGVIWIILGGVCAFWVLSLTKMI